MVCILRLQTSWFGVWFEISNIQKKRFRWRGINNFTYQREPQSEAAVSVRAMVTLWHSWVREQSFLFWTFSYNDIYLAPFAVDRDKDEFSLMHTFWLRGKGEASIAALIFFPPCRPWPTLLGITFKRNSVVGWLAWCVAVCCSVLQCAQIVSA